MDKKFRFEISFRPQTLYIMVAVVFALLWYYQANAALAATTVWEIRTTATAADVNSGGYNPSNASPGTDYSKQDASQFNGTDLASTSGTTNPCVVTSASHNFVSTDNGNLIHINSGTNWTADWYEIVSTAGNAATLDKACGSSASISGGTWHEGGALSLQNALDSTWSGKVVAGNTIWIKAGTYTQTTGFTLTSCTGSAQCFVQGYNSTRGDEPQGSNRPLLNMGGGQLGIGAFSVFKNAQVTGTATTMVTGSNNVYYNLKLTNTGTSSSNIALGPGDGSIVANNEIVSQAGFGITANGYLTAFGNYIHDSPTCVKQSSTGTPTTVSNNILAGCITNGVNVSAADAALVSVYNNTIFGNQTPFSGSSGFNLASGATNTRILGNIIYGFATGINAAGSPTANWGANNDLFNNTTARTNWSVALNDIAVDPGFKNAKVIQGSSGSVSSSTMTDSGADFTTVTDNQDYLDILSGTGVTVAPGSLLITSHTLHSVTTAAAIGGSGSNIVYAVRTGHNFAVGLSVRNKGVPAVFPASLTTSYPSIGGVQQMPGFPLKLW